MTTPLTPGRALDALATQHAALDARPERERRRPGR
jgi:hypothetical protein